MVPVISPSNPAISLHMAPEVNAFKRHLGERILALRKAARMTQAELAEAAGVGNEYISKIERGLGSPSLETLVKVALALQVEIKVLFDFRMTHQAPRPTRDLLRLSSALKNLPDGDVDLVYRLAKRLGKR